MTSLISRVIRSISKLFVFAYALLLVSCLTPDSQLRDEFSPITKVYHEDFEKVWRAAQISLQKYPLRVNNIEKGLLETDFIKGYDVWKPPYISKSPTGLTYKLVLRTIKGKLGGQPAIKVVVFKKIKKQRDFFAEVEKMPSDGMEEKSIHYRISREIQIDNALENAEQSSNEDN